MTTLAIAYFAAQKVQKKTEVINWKIICVSGLFAVFVLLFFYAVLVISLINGTYLAKSYQSQISELSRESRGLEVSFAETGFMKTVRQKAEALNFEKTTSVKYIQILNTSLAKAK